VVLGTHSLGNLRLLFVDLECLLLNGLLTNGALVAVDKAQRKTS
jgi:hypothetical protein